MAAISIENAEHYHWGENCHGWHLVKSKSLSVIQELVPSGSSETRHFHQQAEQFFYVLSGTATFECENNITILQANQGIHVAAGQVHQLRNQHDEDLIFTVTSTPPSHGDRISC
ncbi:cupin domain-containing protein [Thalassotalea sp. PLHSN55]|uniref:cupin domain-containing protein n=1 Tax=Thalassotalea sp. PLHSN55 TaxID=3435888 RepID=UPI003F84253A